MDFASRRGWIIPAENYLFAPRKIQEALAPFRVTRIEIVAAGRMVKEGESFSFRPDARQSFSVVENELLGEVGEGNLRGRFRVTEEGDGKIILELVEVLSRE